MKKIVLLTGILLMMVSVTFAQPHAGCQGSKSVEKEVSMNHDSGPGHCLDMLPGLTDDQKKQIKAKGIAFHKELDLIDAQIKEKKAHLATLELTEPVNLDAINKTIDEMMVLKGDKIKKKTAHHQEIRKMLNDEQKMIFDKHSGNGKSCAHKGHGSKGHGNKCCGDGSMNQGQGPGCGSGTQGSGSGCKGTGK